MMDSRDYVNSLHIGLLKFLDENLEKYLLTLHDIGPVTDYGSTVVHWMRNRQPRFKGGYQGEMERPSPSYIVDVCHPCDLSSHLGLTHI
jgi:hypothetical protein